MLLSLLCQFLGCSDSHSLYALVSFCSPLYTKTLVMHVGIACLCYVYQDSILILHFHAEIVSLTFLACDWLFLIGVYPRLSVVSLHMIGGHLLFVPWWDFNPITSNMVQHIPPTLLGLLVVGNWHKMAATVLECTKKWYMSLRKLFYVHVFIIWQQ